MTTLEDAIEHMKEHLPSTIAAMENDGYFKASIVQFIHNSQQYDLKVSRSSDEVTK